MIKAVVESDPALLLARLHDLVGELQTVSLGSSTDAEVPERELDY